MNKKNFSDPRSLQHQQSWGNTGPNQSKSFRILQKITDTFADTPDQENDEPAVEVQAHYSKPLGPSDMNENQLKKLQLSLTENDRAFMNRVKNQGKTIFFFN